MPASPVQAPPIAVLPDVVADAIAAGEVVERPAAVVKELVENALDAGATRIVVRVEDAGRALIDVVDNGWGIPPDQLTLAFRRHATSKIRTLDDMRAVRSLGFRGEALASIAAVADVEAVSRASGVGDGWRVRVVGGLVREEGAAGAPPGTRVSVRRLFFNTPARLRFLKQPASEAAVIHRVTADLSLAHSDVAISLLADGRPLFSTPGTGDLRAAVAVIYGLEIAGALLEVDDPPVRGLLAPPSLHRATRDQVVILVNRRRIQHRSLTVAVEQAYRGLREPDRYPIAVLGLDLDPAEVDVNVHPTKREVRFRNERAVFQALERACYRTLRRSGLYTVAVRDPGDGLRLQDAPPAMAAQFIAVTPPSGMVRLPDEPAEPGMDEPADGPPGGRPAPVGMLPALDYVGQVLNAYLVAQAADALVLIDQHAAHERVLFDRILAGLERGQSPGSQLGLVPQLVEVSPEQMAAFDQHADWIRSLGFAVDHFGERVLRVSEIPVGTSASGTVPLLQRILDQLDRALTPDRRLREAAALLACHSAVRFGDPMATPAAQALLRDLARTSEPISCPHGRPTTLVLPDHQLRRLFKRP